MSFVKQLAGETVIYGISNILSRVVFFIFLTGYLTRVFQDQAQYGIHQDLYAYMALLLIVFTYRMETAYFRMGSEKEIENKAFYSALTSIITTTIFFSGIMLLFRHQIASLLQYANKSIYVVYMILIISLDALAAIPFARLRLQNRPLRFAFIKVINVFVMVFLVVFFLEFCPYMIQKGYPFFEKIYHPNRQIDLVIIANIISSAVVLIMLLPLILKTPFQFDGKLLLKMSLYLLPLIIVSLAATFNQSFSVPLLKYLLPADKEANLSSAGVYAAGAKLALIMNLFTQAFTYAAEPFFFKRSMDHNAQEIYADVAQAFSLVASVVMLGILLYLDSVIIYLLGPAYRSGVYVVPLLLLAYWFLGLYYNFSLWYKIKDKTYMGAIISVGGALITLVLTVVLIPRYGSIGMAWATLACYFFMTLASYFTGSIYYPVPYHMKRIIGYLLFTFLLYAINETVKYLLHPGLILQIIISTILLSAFVGIIYRTDKEKILSWIGQK
ncbi:MAG: polysaccharide biosynthesis protein [Saprospiraceae bacterium]|nr:polysaccharide biosynthesis protein [Saprospiraceae bacterium]